MEPTPILEFREISKSFPGVKALQAVSFAVRPGEIHAVVGENGAGKSTLMKIAAGLYQPDSGELVLNGQPIRLDGAYQALRLGIAMVPQELNLVRQVTVAENVLLGIEPRGALGVVNRKEQQRRAQEVLSSVGAEIDVNRKLADLTVAEQQLVQIQHALAFQCTVLIMDEPTAALSAREKDSLFERLRRLNQLGTTILYISHRMEEIFEISDRITILRDGALIGTLDRADATQDRLVQMMIGRPLTDYLHTRAPRQQLGKPVLEVRKLNKSGDFEDISFILHEGEILGFAGLVGAGRTEVLSSVFGVTGLDSGEILLDGKQVTINSPVDAIALGIGYVPEERKRLGIFPLLSVLQNITLPFLRQLQRFTVVNESAETKAGQELAGKLRVQTPSLAQQIDHLSGGNQQKVILGRWLGSGAKVLILDEPTRGIDINAKAEIHAFIAAMADEGKSILLISSEMQELTAISDRILILRQGRIVGEADPHTVAQEELLRMAVLGPADLAPENGGAAASSA